MVINVFLITNSKGFLVKKEQFFIVIAGNIASGKTTLAKRLAKTLKIKMYEEPVLDNPFLDKFYYWLDMVKKNPKNKVFRKKAQKSSFELQEFYLLNRVLDHKKIMSFNEPIIQDRSIYEDKEIFTENAYRSKTISFWNYIRYRIVYFFLTARLQRPDLLIYLATSTPTLKKRLKKRGHDYEQELTLPTNKYLAQLNKQYKKFIKNYTRGPKYIINSEQYDFSTNQKDVEVVANKIKEILELKTKRKNK